MPKYLVFIDGKEKDTIITAQNKEEATRQARAVLGGDGEITVEETKD